MPSRRAVPTSSKTRQPAARPGAHPAEAAETVAPAPASARPQPPAGQRAAKKAPAASEVFGMASGKAAATPKAGKATKPLKPAKAPKLAKTSKPAKPPKVASAAAPAVDAKPPKQKLVRDSFTIPRGEYQQLDTLKQRLVTLLRPTKKSELLRAGIKLLSSLADDALLAAVSEVPAIKTGRPGKP